MGSGALVVDQTDMIRSVKDGQPIGPGLAASSYRHDKEIPTGEFFVTAAVQSLEPKRSNRIEWVRVRFDAIRADAYALVSESHHIASLGWITIIDA